MEASDVATAAAEAEVLAWRRAHPSPTLTELEQFTAEVAQRLQRNLLEGLTAELAACPHCRTPMERRGSKVREVLVAHQPTPLRQERPYFVCPACHAGLSPLDEALGLVPGSLSPQLLEGVMRLGSSLPFARASEELAYFWGVWVSEDTVRRHTERAGAALVAVEQAAPVRLARDWPAPPQGPAVQQWSMDVAMVSLLHREWAEVKTALVGRVEQRRGEDGTPEAHATDLVYCSRLADVGAFTHALRLLVHRTGLHTARTVAAVSDGARWIQGVVDVYRRDAVRILDFPHALEHLALAGGAAFGVDTPGCHAWLAEQARTLKHGAPEDILSALRALPIAAAADPARAARVRDETLGYLEARLPQVQYAAFQAQGLPIGSGAVESANKLVVEARLKGPGMHWARANVNPMVALRACRGSDRWAQDWPAILAHLRTEEGTRREARRLQQHPPPPRPGPPNLRLLRSASRKLTARRNQPAPKKRAS